MFFPKQALILSFEGPDPYAQVGGLAVRVTELAGALSHGGIAAEIVFIGDPHYPQRGRTSDGVDLYRVLQNVSRDYPSGVYDGEYNKADALAGVLPEDIIERHIAPAAQRGEQILILAEEWQTVKAAVALDRKLRERRMRKSAVILWNANNTYGFENIDWVALQSAATITTISKFMKFEMRARGVNALVIPNGIPQRLLEGPPQEFVRKFEASLRGDPLLVKVGRFDPDKRWLQAIDAVDCLHKKGRNARLVMRGNGNDAHGREVTLRAKSTGLSVEDISAPSEDPRFFEMLAQSQADILNIVSTIPQPVLFALYAAADAVLANSGKEPFGLVGLEVMAAGGLPVCGATGEEYAEPFVNAIVCDTDDGLELATYLESTISDSREVHRIHTAAHATAQRYTWPMVLNVLRRKLEFIAARTAQVSSG